MESLCIYKQFEVVPCHSLAWAIDNKLIVESISENVSIRYNSFGFKHRPDKAGVMIYFCPFCGTDISETFIMKLRNKACMDSDS